MVDRQRAIEVHSYATPIYNLGKCRLTDKFFISTLATLVLSKGIPIFECPCCSIREDLSIDFW